MDSYVGAVAQLLKANVSSLGGRCSPMPVPSNAVFPYATIVSILDSELESLTGQSGLVHTVIQVSVNDKSYETAWRVRGEVEEFLRPFTGVTSSSKIAAVNSGPKGETYDANRSLHQLHLRLFVWWEK